MSKKNSFDDRPKNILKGRTHFDEKIVNKPAVNAGLDSNVKAGVKRHQAASAVVKRIDSYQIDKIKGNGDIQFENYAKDELKGFSRREDALKKKTNATSEEATKVFEKPTDGKFKYKEATPQIVIEKDKKAEKVRFKNAGKLGQIKIASKKITGGAFIFSEKASHTAAISQAITKQEDCISPKDRTLVKVLQFSADKNVSQAKKYKNIQKAAKKEIKAIDKQLTYNAAKEKLDFTGKEKNTDINVKSNGERTAVKLNKNEIFQFSTSKGIDAKAVFNFEKKEKLIGTPGSGIDKQKIFIKSNTKDMLIFNNIEEKRDMLDKVKKAAASAKRKEYIKAGAKRAVANHLQAKMAVINKTLNDNTTGDPYKDGMPVMLEEILNRIKSAFKNMFKRLLKSIALKLLAAIAPMLPLIVVIVLMFSVIPHMEYSPKELLECLPSGDNRTIRGRWLWEEEIEEYLAVARRELYPNTTGQYHVDLNFGESNTIEDADKEKILVAIEYALRAVGSEYCQVHRLGVRARPGTVCEWDELGYPKVHEGGVSFDCSGLVWCAYKKAGPNIAYRGDNTAAGEAMILTEKDKGLRSTRVLPGDLFFYGQKKNGRYLGIYHVALYIGGGKTVEASNSTSGVVLRDIVKSKTLIFVARPFYKEKKETNKKE